MLSSLIYHQIYLTKYINKNNNNIIQDTKLAVKILLYSFIKNSKSDLIILEDPIDIEFSLITTLIYIINFNINYINNRVYDNITVRIEFTQDHDFVLLFTDEIDKYNRYIYKILFYYNYNILNIKENNYYP